MHHREDIQTLIDSTTIIIKISYDPTRISSVYKSPKAQITNKDLDLLTNHGGLFLIAGDLNAKHTTWYCCKSNTAGRVIHRHMETSNTYIVYAPDSPTHFPFNIQHRPEVLDISLINLPHFEYTLTNHNELSSDQTSSSQTYLDYVSQKI